MALSVTGGPLEFDAQIDLNTESLLAQMNEASKIISNVGGKGVNELVQKFSTASITIKNLLAKGIQGAKLDPHALSDLQNQVESTTDEFKQLQSVTKFIQQNLGRLNLAPDEIKQLQQAIDTVSASFDTMSQKELAPLTRLRQIRNELTELATAGAGAENPQFKKLLAEASEIEHAMKNVNQALSLTSQEAPGLAALGQGFRGLLGGVEAVAGTLGLFNDNEEETAKITKNLIALQTIFNGVQEISALLSKESALNIFLEQKFRKANALTLEEETTAAIASNVAKEAGIEVTEAATVAEQGLNKALLANPVALILVGIVALYGAYQILANTIFKASDATRRARAEEEALNDARKKAADTIADEQASIALLVSQAEDLNSTDQQRGRAINELRAKYPEYLSNLKQEDILTGRASEAIAKQIELIRKKATAAAAEEIYKDRLKKVLEAQIELNKFQQISADESRKNIGFFQGLLTNESGKLQAINFKVAQAQKEVHDATLDADGAFKAAQGTQRDLNAQMNTTTDAIQVQIDRLTDLSSKGGNSHMFDGIIAGLKVVQANLDKFQSKPFDPKAYEEDKKNALAAAQYKVDVAKKGFAQELNERKKFIQAELDEAKKDRRLFDEVGNPIKDAKTGKPNADALAALGKFQSAMNDLNLEFSERALKNITASAKAIVLALQAAGEEGSAKFFEAQRKAIIAAAHEEIVAAKDNAGERKRIEEQLALDLHNLQLAQQRQELENQKSILNARLTLVTEGSDEELKLRKQLIDASAKEEILQAGTNQAKINEINAQAAKDKFELDKKFTIEANKTSAEIVIAGIETRLALVQQGTDEELSLRKAELQAKEALDIQDAKAQIKNEQLLQAKIKEIRAKSLADQRKLENDFFRDLLQKQLSTIQSQADAATAELQSTIENPLSTIRQKQEAQIQQTQIQLDGLKKQRQIIFQDLERGHGDANELERQVNELDAKIAQAEANHTNLVIKTSIDKLNEFAKIVGAIGQGLGTLATDLKEVNSDLANLISGLSQAAKTANEAITAFTDFSSGDIAGGIGSVVNILSDIINSFSKNKAERKRVEQEILDFQTKIIEGEQAYQELLRQRARESVLANKTVLQGILDQQKLLESQSNAVKDSFQEILDKIHNEQFVAGLTEKEKINIGAIFQGLSGVGNLKTKTIKELMETLAGKSFDELEQLFMQGQLSDKAKELFEQLQKLRQEGADIDALLEENKQKAAELFTGTTSDAILDAITEGFAQGKHTIADFAGTFEDFMKQSMLNTFKFKYLQEPLQKFFDDFAAASSDQTLSETDIAQLKDNFAKIIANADQQFKQLEQIAGINFTSTATASQNTLQGAFRTMSEDTGNLLAGQFAGQRIATIEIREIQRSALTNLNNIESNTADTVQELRRLLSLVTDVTLGTKAFKIS